MALTHFIVWSGTARLALTSPLGHFVRPWCMRGLGRESVEEEEDEIIPGARRMKIERAQTNEKYTYLGSKSCGDHWPGK